MEAPCPCAVLLNKEDAGERFTASQAERLTDKRPFCACPRARARDWTRCVSTCAASFATPMNWPSPMSATWPWRGRRWTSCVTRRAGLASGGLIDLAAVDLHEALYLLGRITGDSVDEKLLDDIFSRFCVGK